MARGGKRPGAGRPKGSGQRIKPMALGEAPGTDTPLGYMLRVMNDPGVDDDRRDKMAMAAASFMHARLAPSSPSKKEDRQEAAAKAGKAGRFATPATPPKLIVNNA